MEKFTKPELLNFLCEGVDKEGDLLSLEKTTYGTNDLLGNGGL